MDIFLIQQGGHFGLDREVEVKGGVVTLIDHGVRKAPRRLDESKAACIYSLAARVAKVGDLIVHYNGSPVSDSMETKIVILDGKENMTFQVRSGDEAPDEVWELLKTANEAAAG